MEKRSLDKNNINTSSSPEKGSSSDGSKLQRLRRDGGGTGRPLDGSKKIEAKREVPWVEEEKSGESRLGQAREWALQARDKFGQMLPSWETLSRVAKTT